MMKAVRRVGPLFVFALLLNAGDPLVVDTTQTKVEFTLPSLLHTVHGEFRLKRGALHGADHEILVPATVEAAGGAYAVTATFEIPYVKWGLKNPSTLMLRVSDTVELRVQTRLAPPSTGRTGN